MWCCIGRKWRLCWAFWSILLSLKYIMKWFSLKLCIHCSLNIGVKSKKPRFLLSSQWQQLQKFNSAHHTISEKVWTSSPVENFLVFCDSQLKTKKLIITHSKSKTKIIITFCTTIILFSGMRNLERNLFL